MQPVPIIIPTPSGTPQARCTRLIHYAQIASPLPPMSTRLALSSSRAARVRAGPPARRVVSVRAFQVTMQTPAGQTKCFAAEAGSSLLEGALAAGVDTPHLCKTGSCGACAAKLLEGSVERSDFLLDDAQAAAGYVLLCTSTPTSDVTVLTGQETELHTLPYGL